MLQHPSKKNSDDGRLTVQGVRLMRRYSTRRDPRFSAYILFSSHNVYFQIRNLTNASVHLTRITMTVNADTTDCITLVTQADVIRSEEEYNSTIGFLSGHPVASGMLTFELRI